MDLMYINMDILWTGLWTNYGLLYGLDGLHYGLTMDYFMDCLWTGLWTTFFIFCEKLLPANIVKRI